MKQLAALAEKAALSGIEVWLAAVILAGDLNASSADQAFLAAIAAILTVVANGLPEVRAGLHWVYDLAWRTVRTFAVGFLTALTAADLLHLDLTNLRVAAMGALPAAFAVAKGIISSRLGARTPALLPASLDPAA